MDSDYNIEVGKKIHDRRKALRMSMKTLGKKVNLHESTISRYEKGEIQSLDIEKIKEFAKALDISISYLISWDDLDNSVNPDLYKIINKLRFDKNISIEEVLRNLDDSIDINKETKTDFLSTNTNYVKIHKEWYEKVGEFNWTENKFELLMHCAVFIKDVRNRKDNEDLLNLVLKIMDKLKK